MKNSFLILLIGLMFLPVIWNGLSLFHYVVEHTHVFCDSGTNHDHDSSQDCLSFCHINKYQEHHHPVSTIEFFELKQYITPAHLFVIQPSSFTLLTTNNKSSIFNGRIYSNKIFHPPIC